MRKFKEYNPGLQRSSAGMDQLLLMPPDIREWLPEDHLAYFISDVAEELDLGEIYEAYDSSEGGQPAYHPLMMVRTVHRSRLFRDTILRQRWIGSHR
ncbi:MAG: hypothetical protein M1469_00835 [Bacteroidetes bacterium]|nr:hypothetical protein [Bacteroidota bacterium]